MSSEIPNNAIKFKPKKRNKKDLHPQTRESLGAILKSRRIELNYSLNDIELMTDMSKTMAWSVEKGRAKGIDYYVEYANAVSLVLFTTIQDDPNPRYELPEKNKNRIYLTARIRELKEEFKLFQKDTTVKDIITFLNEKKGVSNIKGLSTKIAGILRNWIEEDETLTKRKEGNINLYRINK